MSMIHRALTSFKTNFKFIGRRLYLISIACLIATMTIGAQPFLTNAAGTSTNNSLVGHISSKVSIPLGKKVDSILLNSTSQQSSDKSRYIAGNWQSWEGDKKWFMDNFCTGGNEKWCEVNAPSLDSGGKKGRDIKVTAMAAGFDTRARVLIRVWKCKGWGLSCGWRHSVDDVVEPRQFKTWTYPDNNIYATITPISGDPRVHLAVTLTTGGAQSSPNSGQFPYQSFNFCVMEGLSGSPGGGVSFTRSVWANNYDEAQQKLYQDLGYAGVGAYRDVRRGACQ